MHRNRGTEVPTAERYSHSAGTRTYRVKHDFDGSAELTTTLAHAISDVTGLDVTDTAFTLNDYVDLEALDRLFKPSDDGRQRIDGHLSFDVWGYEVTVHSDGQIEIVPPREPVQRTQGQRRY